MQVEEHVNALFSGEELSDDFKAKATTVFEAALQAEKTKHIEIIQEEFDEAVEVRVTEQLDELAEKMDQFLDFVIEEWMKSNQIAVEQSLRHEITEDFMVSLKKLFEEHHIDVPDAKVDVLEQQKIELEKIRADLNEQIQANITLKADNAEHAKESIFADVTEGLTDTEVTKMAKLAEGVTYEDDDAYKGKLTIIKENYFQADSEATTPEDEESATVDGDHETIEEEVQLIESSVDIYADAMTRKGL